MRAVVRRLFRPLDFRLEREVDGLVRHIARVRDDWAEIGPGEVRNRALWAPLHARASEVWELLDERAARRPRAGQN